MEQRAPINAGKRPIESALADELARGDLALMKIGPVLGHLLGNDDHALFSDEVVARVRGMIDSLAQQFAHAEVEALAPVDGHRRIVQRSEAIGAQLVQVPSLLGHCHALGLEWQLALRLESEHALDPVLSPLIQALIASDEPTTASLGMGALAAQARFAQAQRRMELSLGELPADIFHATLLAWRAQAGPTSFESLSAADAKLRMNYDEGASRLALLERLVVAMGGGVTAALSIDHAGTALFLSALAAASGQSRDSLAVATNERQASRLLLALRSTGLKSQAVDELLVYLHRETNVPEGASAISPEKAARLLDRSWNGMAGRDA